MCSRGQRGVATLIDKTSGIIVKNSKSSKAGLTQIRHLLYEVVPGVFTPKAVVEIVHDLSDCPPSQITAKYANIKTAIPGDWLISCNRSTPAPGSELSEVKVILPADSIPISKCTTKQFSILHNMSNTITMSCIAFWATIFPDFELPKLWSHIYGGIKPNYLADNDYKIYHNGVFTNILLVKIAMSDSPVCGFCKFCDESLMHLLVDCFTLRPFWFYIFQLLNKIVVDVDFANTMEVVTVFGFHDYYDKTKLALINLILSLARYVILIRRLTLKDSGHVIDPRSIFKSKLLRQMREDLKYFSLNNDLYLFEVRYDVLVKNVTSTDFEHIL
jgi:hypothetical protein